MSEAALRLNLGCGDQRPEGWLNLDSSPGARLARWPRLFALLRRVLPQRLLPSATWSGANVRWMDLTRPWPLGEGCADAIYSSHFLEHLELEESRHVLREASRVLRSGGRIRLIVPDLEAIVAAYERHRQEKPEQAALQFRHDTGFFTVPLPKTFRAYLRYRVTRRHDHQLLHDEAFLRSELESAGFVGVERRACGDSGIAGIDAVDSPDRFENALCLEAVKP